MEIILSRREMAILEAFSQRHEVSKVQAIEHLVQEELDNLTDNNGTIRRTPIMNKVERYPSRPEATDNQIAPAEATSSPVLKRLEDSIRRRWRFGRGEAPLTMPEAIIPALLTSGLRRQQDEGYIKI